MHIHGLFRELWSRVPSPNSYNVDHVKSVYHRSIDISRFDVILISLKCAHLIVFIANDDSDSDHCNRDTDCIVNRTQLMRSVACVRFGTQCTCEMVCRGDIGHYCLLVWTQI